MKDSRIVIIFDECHRSQFGENHKAIKNFFPKAQLFGFTGTPIFEENATYKQIDGTIGSYTTTKDIFEKELHAYTITHAIDDRNVLRFHIDYFKLENDRDASEINEEQQKRAVVQAVLSKHDAVTNSRKYNAILATASINDAIEYYNLFKETQQCCTDAASNEFRPLNIACVFSPPAEGNKDVQQIQEDLPQEKEDNKKEPDKKKQALMGIIRNYNEQYGTSHDINNFDGYYQDIQQRIKDQKYTNADYPHKNKIDITIVVDMLLTGFDSKYLNTLYVDKNLKYHGLIQAFSRTNRVLNDTKPYGNILDFRNQSDEVDKAIALFSGENNSGRAKEIWLVDPAPKVVEKLDKAVSELKKFMESQGLECKPKEVNNLKGDAARCEFVNKFKEIQRLKTQLEQYTEIEEKDAERIEELLPEDTLRAFRGAYIDVAQRLKAEQGKEIENKDSEVEQLDFEFVLFSSAIIDYDYIMALIAKYTQSEPKKQKMSKEQLIGMLSAIAEVTSYVDYRGKTPVKSKEGVFLITAKNIKMGYIDYNASKEYIPKEQYLAVMSRGIPQLGDVLITTEAPCGNVAQIDKVDVALAQRVIKYRGNKHKINNTFLKYVFLSPVFQSELKRNSSGGIVGGIKGSVLHQMSIKFPDDMIEQQKIADCLSEIDTVITGQSNKVKQLKTHKKGLMQGLFPSLEEADV